MFASLVAGLGLSVETALIVLVALAVGVLLARVVLSIAWKLLIVGVLVVGSVYAAGVLL